jgi:polyhydroxybutyrate depolymerase
MSGLYKLTVLFLISFFVSFTSDGTTKTHQLEHKDTLRNFRLFIPSGLSKDKLHPLLIAMHGGGGSAKGFQDSAGLDEYAVQHGYFVVYPEGTGRKVFTKKFATWNAGVKFSHHEQQEIDDVGFIHNMLNWLAKNYPLDTSKVYATGHSNGSQMSYRLACELSEQITAIAPVGAQMEFKNCKPKRAVPILHIHGDTDLCAKPEGGQCGGCWQKMLKSLFPLLSRRLKDKNWKCKPLMDTLNPWMIRHRLSNTEPEILEVFPKHQCETWSEHGLAGPLTVCLIKNHGHAWPSKTPGGFCKHPNSRKCKVSKKVTGPISTGFDAPKLMFDFFGNHVINN